MNTMEEPIFITVEPNVNAMPNCAIISASNPWGNSADVGFHYVKVDYPKFHTHNHWELFIILSGTVMHEINEESHVLQKGSAFLIRPQDKHRLIKSNSVGQETYKNLNFLIRTESLQALLHGIDGDLYEKLLNAPFPLSFVVKSDLMQRIMKKTILMQSHTPPSNVDLSRCRLLIQELLIYYLEEFFYEQPSQPEWLSDFLLCIQDPKYFNLPIPKIAEFAPFSYSRFSHLFKELMGVTLVDYITSLKLTYAKSLLKHTAMSIVEIAMECQWALSNFNKVFKAKTGISPSEYRKSVQITQSTL